MGDLANPEQERIPLLHSTSFNQAANSLKEESCFDTQLKDTYSTGRKMYNTCPLGGNSEELRSYGATHDSVLEIKEGNTWIRIKRDDDGDDDDDDTVPLVHPGEETSQLPSENKKTWKVILKNVKISVLFLGVLISTAIFSVFPDTNYLHHQASVSKMQPFRVNLSSIEVSSNFPVVKLVMVGSWVLCQPSEKTNRVNFTVINPATQTEKIHILCVGELEDIKEGDEIIATTLMDFRGEEFGSYMHLEVCSTTNFATPVTVSYNSLSPAVYDGYIYAAAILLMVYVIIIFELVHRAVAAIIGSVAALAALAALNQKPTLEQVLEWLDYETLCLLFGMMVIVAIFCESGFFDWLALKAYKLASGKTWPLITILCLFAAIVSAFLDNVTTILLLTPVTIRLCEVLGLDPKHVLMMEVVFSNIGGTATAVGDPPNVLIVSNKDLIDESDGKVNFTSFTLHLAVGSVFVTIAAYIFIRILYRRKELLKQKEPPEVTELKREVEVWRRTINSICVASREESMVRALLFQKINTLEHLISIKRQRYQQFEKKDFNIRFEELEKKYVIHDKVLLIKSLFVLLVVMLCFFLQSFLSAINLGLGWIAIFGAIWLLVLADYSDIESVLHRIEWATLLFFAALFVLMQALERLGLITWIGDQTSSLIRDIPESSRMAVAIIMILWVSALASSFIDNIPFTTAMIPVVVQLSNDESLGLELSPLVWALAFGACLGGNGTLIGASANVVCAGIAETHGHGFTFFEFFKVGFPTMLVTVTVAMCYLLVCHVAFSWSL